MYGGSTVYDVCNEHKITKADLVAMKGCNSLMFTFRPDSSGGKDHQATITCTLDKTETNPWEQRHVVPVNSYVQFYTNWHYVKPPVVTFARYWARPDYEIISDILALIKPDDVLTMVWQGDNNNLHMDACDLHADRLLLQIRTVTAKGEWKTRKFILATSISKNNSVRMLETIYSDFTDEFKESTQYKETQQLRLNA
jgi:hypothetical protein